MNLFNRNEETLLSQERVFSTIVTFPGGRLTEETHLLLEPWEINERQSAIFTEKTPFHPLDYQWPDQPADRGWIKIEGKVVPVQDCLIAAIHENKIYLDCDIPVGKNATGWEFLVAHIVDKQDLLGIKVLPDGAVFLQVNSDFRNSISRAHTAAHLMSLALNKAIFPYWKKITEMDDLSSPNFDKHAIEKARLAAHRSEDTYRFGKSIRKKGLNVDSMLENLSIIEKNTNDFLSEILSKKPMVDVTPEESLLNSRREWRCRWDDKYVKIPCGGTHLLDQVISEIRVKFMLEPIEKNSLTVITTVILK